MSYLVVTQDGSRWDYKGDSFPELLRQGFPIQVDPPGTKDTGWFIQPDKVVAFRREED